MGRKSYNNDRPSNLEIRREHREMNCRRTDVVKTRQVKTSKGTVEENYLAPGPWKKKEDYVPFRQWVREGCTLTNDALSSKALAIRQA